MMRGDGFGWFVFVFGLIFGFFGGWCAGMPAGKYMGVEQERREAIGAGVGRWECDPKEGTVFRYGKE